MEAEATESQPKLRQPQGAKLGIKVGKRGQSTKIQRKRKLKKLERVRFVLNGCTLTDSSWLYSPKCTFQEGACFTQRVLLPLQALSHSEKVSERGTKAQLRTQQRQTAKSLWNAGKANANMFSVLGI